jgi:hypothetical protein
METYHILNLKINCIHNALISYTSYMQAFSSHSLSVMAQWRTYVVVMSIVKTISMTTTVETATQLKQQLREKQRTHSRTTR